MVLLSNLTLTTSFIISNLNLNKKLLLIKINMQLKQKIIYIFKIWYMKNNKKLKIHNFKKNIKVNR